MLRRLIFSVVALLSLASANAQTSNSSNESKAIFDHFFMSAMQYKVRGEYEKMIEMLRNCLIVNRDNACVYYELASILKGTQNVDEAINFAEKAVSLDSAQNATYIRTAIDANIAGKRNDRVCELYEMLLKLMPDDVATYFEYYEFLERNSLYKKAEALLNRVPAPDAGTRYEVDIRRQSVYLSMLNYRKCKKILDKLYKENPNNKRTVFCLSHYHFMLREYDKSIARCIEATKCDGGEAYLFALAELYRRTRQDSLFAETYVKAFESPAISLLNKMSNFYQEIYNQDKPVLSNPGFKPMYHKVCFSLLNQFPNDPEVALMTSEYYSKIGNTNRAAAILMAYIDSGNEGDESIYRNLFMLIEGKVNDDFMLKYAKRAYEDVPDHLLFMYVYGVYSSRVGNHAEAINVLSKFNPAVLNNERNKSLKSGVLHVLAESYLKTDSLSKCFAVYDLLIEDDPKDAVALNNYAYYLAIHDMDLEKAESMSSKSISLNPNNISNLDTYAYILYKRGKHSEALFVMERCADLTSNMDAVVLEHYGDILFALGRKDEALKRWAESLSKNPENPSLQKRYDENK